MIITRIQVENFRSLQNIDVECDNILAILGKNGAGKSTILYALDKFYDTSATQTPFDYFNKDVTKEIKISVTYGNLKPDELSEFSAYVTNNQLIVTKIINSGGHKYFSASKQLPEFEPIRKLGARDKIAAFNQLVKDNFHPELTTTFRGGADVDNAMIGFENNHPELLIPFQTEAQFFGAKNIGGGKLDKFTKFVLIPAVRDATSELEKKGAILQLIDVLVTRTVNARPDVRLLNEEIERRVQEVYSNNNLTELQQLGTRITEFLRRFSPGAELDLNFGEVKPPTIPLPPAIASLVEDNFKCPINYTGHGLQRALIFALLQQLALTIVPANDTPDAQTSASTHLPDLILAIEEPELYLHPSRCRHLSKVLLDLATPPASSIQPCTQILYATHSPYFVDMGRFNQIRIARKVESEGIDTLQTKISKFTLIGASEELGRVAGLSSDAVTAESFVVRATPVMTLNVNEGFFADLVVVVEGDSDIAALWTIQGLKNYNWDALGISIVSANGKNNIDRPIVIFRGLEIPTYFVFDGDSSHTGSDRNKSRDSNHRLLTLAGATVEDFPDTVANATWACFNDNIEKELKNSLGETDFNMYRDSIANTFGYSQPSKIFKNSECMSALIEAIYRDGKSIPILEAIVESIQRLRIG